MVSMSQTHAAGAKTDSHRQTRSAKLQRRRHKGPIAPKPLPGFLRLPDELLLKVLIGLHHRPRDRQKDLCSVALVCRQLAPVARDVLLQQPSVHLFNVPSLVRTYFAYPDLAKARTLELASRSFQPGDAEQESYERDIDTPPQRVLDLQSSPVFMKQCTTFIRRPIGELFVGRAERSMHKGNWIADLKSHDQYQTAYLAILLYMLPNLKHLFLSQMTADKFPTVWNYIHGGPVREMHMGRYLELVFEHLTQRLATLELPREHAFGGIPFDDQGVSLGYFTSLRHLTVSAGLLDEDEGGNCTDLKSIMPPNLETLVILDAMPDPETFAWTGHVLRLAPWVRIIEVYYEETPTAITDVKKAANSAYLRDLEATIVHRITYRSSTKELELRLRYTPVHNGEVEAMNYGPAHRYMEEELRQVEQRFIEALPE